MDEPTNHLDRESLVALIEALKEFQGGSPVIPHKTGVSPGPSAKSEFSFLSIVMISF